MRGGWAVNCRGILGFLSSFGDAGLVFAQGGDFIRKSGDFNALRRGLSLEACPGRGTGRYGVW